MEQIISVVAGGALFLSVVTDYQVRESLESSGRALSPARIRAWGLGAGALVMAMATLICLLLATAGA